MLDVTQLRANRSPSKTSPRRLSFAQQVAVRHRTGFGGGVAGVALVAVGVVIGCGHDTGSTHTAAL
jgi:hypothetical protein